jgi:hypothetical protein
MAHLEQIVRPSRAVVATQREGRNEEQGLASSPRLVGLKYYRGCQFVGWTPPIIVGG